MSLCSLPRLMKGLLRPRYCCRVHMTAVCRIQERSFEPAPLGKSPEEWIERMRGKRFRVVTYNILANCYAFDFQRYCPRELLQWESRRNRILEELQKYDADLLCLQEVEREFYEGDLEPWFLKQGYEGIHFTKRLAVPGGFEEGCALFYRGSVFSRISSRRFFFSDELGFGGSGQFFRAVKDQRDGAILALLKHCPSGQHLLVCSVHLYWNPKWPDVKLAQAHALCGAISKFLNRQCEPFDTPVLICGDFNSIWRKHKVDDYDKIIDGRYLTAGAYKLLTDGEVDSSHPHHPFMKNHGAKIKSGHIRNVKFSSSGRLFESAYFKGHGSEPLVTNSSNDFQGCLDYIFLSKDRFDVLETLSLPYDSDSLENANLVNFLPMPNAAFPSDHLALGATVAFR